MNRFVIALAALVASVAANGGDAFGQGSSYAFDHYGHALSHGEFGYGGCAGCFGAPVAVFPPGYSMSADRPLLPGYGCNDCGNYGGLFGYIWSESPYPNVAPSFPPGQGPYALPPLANAPSAVPQTPNLTPQTPNAPPGSNQPTPGVPPLGPTTSPPQPTTERGPAT
jgi:hypothetical protein